MVTKTHKRRISLVLYRALSTYLTNKLKRESQNLLLTSCWLFSRCAHFPLLYKGLLVVACSVLVNRKSRLRLLMMDGGSG
ncbi:unnamed protein product, partial [Vitis vinifera]|uniref:Uncharacterized protein n=1 Tax=Vitis vinifera TaxID=29760 RepID=D7UDL4_VITVI